MAWQSFNDVYIPKSGGGDIEGSLSVSGNLVVNDGSGNGTTYDVASEISDLKSAWDSVSQETSKPISRCYSEVIATTNPVVIRTLSELAADFKTSTDIVKNYNVCSQNGDPAASNNVVCAWISAKGLSINSASSIQTRVNALVVAP